MNRRILKLLFFSSAFTSFVSAVTKIHNTWQYPVRVLAIVPSLAQTGPVSLIAGEIQELVDEHDKPVSLIESGSTVSVRLARPILSTCKLVFSFEVEAKDGKDVFSYDIEPQPDYVLGAKALR